MSEEIQKLALFQKQEIRRQLYNGEWWFVVNDVIAVLTDSTNPAQYLRNMRNRDTELAELMEVAPVDKGVVQIEHPLYLTFDTEGGPQKLRAPMTCGECDRIPMQQDVEVRLQAKHEDS